MRICNTGVHRTAGIMLSARRKVCRISEFGVDAALRRRGAASAMIDFCRTEAKKRKLERLEPDVWSFNRDAVRFCEAAGFETYRQYMEVKP